ncbi:tetraspanin-11-like [Oscarella lobularis]|uniref:tetraspanin-11-like n=1 Tax=Oscarella lobularis TaxID=121494 RepID=UPI003313A9D5
MGSDHDLSTGMKIVKYLLFIFNFIFWAGGVTVLGVGIWLKIEYDSFLEIADTEWANAANILIAAGCLITLLGFLGCIGACCESRIALLIFAVLLCLTFIVEIVAGILAAVYRDKVEDTLTESLEKTIKEYNTSDPVRKAWDTIQEKFSCCGVNGTSDWNMYGMSIPDSCCKTMSGSTCTVYYAIGCKPEFQKFIEDNLIAVAGIGIALALIQIMGIIFACCLASALKS